jgi:hypothetical protein
MTKINVGIGHLRTGIAGPDIAGPDIAGPDISVQGYVGFQAWRVRPTTGAKSVLGGPVMTDALVTKPLLVSASERCP